MRTDHVVSAPTPSPIMSTIPNFLCDFITIFRVNMHNLPYLAIFSIHSSHAFQCHSVPVHSGDCSSVSTGISIFRNFGWQIPLEWHRNPQEWLESGRNQWGIDKSSKSDWNNEHCVQPYPLSEKQRQRVKPPERKADSESKPLQQGRQGVESRCAKC